MNRKLLTPYGLKFNPFSAQIPVEALWNSPASGQAVAYGVLEAEPITEEHARHLVEDDGAQAPAEKELRIVATSIEIID